MHSDAVRVPILEYIIDRALIVPLSCTAERSSSAAHATTCSMGFDATILGRAKAVITPARSVWSDFVRRHSAIPVHLLVPLRSVDF